MLICAPFSSTTDLRVTVVMVVMAVTVMVMTVMIIVTTSL
jgi:hypothetical protein